MTGSILVLNAGSSSVKYQLIDQRSEATLASGLVERIGHPVSQLRHSNGHDTTSREVTAADHAQAVAAIVAIFNEEGPSLTEAGVVGVGHRVVMGGPDLFEPLVIDDSLVATIEDLAPLAPLHNPANAATIKIARALLPNVPHVAVFDTAFFQKLPSVASSYAIDPDIARAHGIRRYGFHGISHEYVSATVAKFLAQRQPSPVRQELRQVVLHLGNGASASAVVGPRAVDTSMGFTPLEGLVMGTRSGDIDPSVAFYLVREHGMTLDEVDHLLNYNSGLLGLAGSNDMRDVHAAIANGSDHAALGLAIYVRRLQKYIGAYAAAMGGIDAITFTAGVGENDPVVRSATIEQLEFLGARIDPAANAAGLGGVDSPTVISTADSRVTVLVAATREELSIARQVVALI